jgi:uncharacterized membrane protein
METYFKIKMFAEFVIPFFILGLVIIFFLYQSFKNRRKTKLMEKLGYEYKKGLGTKVAYEFQPHWVKGDIKINWRKVDSLKYSELKSFVESKEKEH